MLDNEHEERRGGFRPFFTNRLVQILALVSIGFWLLVVAGVSGEDLVELTTIALAAVLLVVTYRWARQAYSELVTGGSGGRAQLMVGVVSLALSTVGVLIWTLVWRNNGYPNWMVVHPFLAFMRLWSVVGGVLMLSSPGSTNGAIPIANLRWLIGAGVLVGIMIGFMFGASLVPKTAGPLVMMEDSENPVCPANRPVVVTSSGKAHAPGTRYWQQVERPVKCFPNFLMARLRGYPAAN